MLHESGKRRIVLVPFYMSRSAGTAFAAKIQSYAKAPPPNAWVVVEEHFVSLNEEVTSAAVSQSPIGA